MAETLGWNEAERAARDVFHVWTDSSCEADWAHHAWSHLERAGLTLYEEDDEVDRCRVAARFIALCNVYYDFVHLAWQEEHSLLYGELAGILRCEPADVLALASSHRQWKESHANYRADDPDEEAGYSVEDALKFLSDAEHDTVVKALADGFGGDEGLFFSLWRSHPEYHYETDGEIGSEATADKMVAYEWITAQGCEDLRAVRDGYG